MKRELQTMSKKLIGKEILIFDFDGTIADTGPLHEIAFKEILATYNVNFDYKDIAGKRTKEAINYILKREGRKITEDELNNLEHDKQKKVRALIKTKLEPIEEVTEFLNWAKEKYCLTIYTSGSRRTIEISLESLGYSRYFNLVVCSEDVMKGKPDPEGFLKIIDITKHKKTKALIFEDSESGIEAAKLAGIDYIDVRNGFFKSFSFC
jgi:HAD superfamily hydrolase (TIGR01509 family)